MSVGRQRGLMRKTNRPHHSGAPGGRRGGSIDPGLLEMRKHCLGRQRRLQGMRA